MAEHETKPIKITQLLLNQENPRFSIQDGQRAAIKVILKDQGDKLFRLANNIVEVGTNPSDLPMVRPSKEAKNMYEVLEGNRRITALKMLIEPKLADLAGSPAVSKRYKALSKVFNKNPIDKLDCVIFTNDNSADHWVELKHTGENQGVGTVGWDGTAKARFRERRGKPNPALQAIDFIKANAKLDRKTQESLDNGNVSVTNLNRLLGDPYVRSFLGLEIEDGTVQAILDPKEILKCLTRIIKDLANKDITVSDIYHKKDREEYIEDFPKPSIPNHKNRSDKKWPLHSPIDTTVSKKPPKKRSIPLSIERKKIIPPNCTLRITDKRINSIYDELKRRIPVDELPNAGAVLLRVFFEFSVNHYLEENNITVYPTDNLKERFKKVLKDIKDNKLLSKNDLKPATVAVGNPDGLFSTETFNAYVHNKKFLPIANDLKTTWDNMQPVFEIIWT